ncbi:hypothetical protein MRQ36_10970 [Micromonospora sp. R77]|uniref:hypothetical protein n=1 Tax=Micromonospora sp. R77 TaxID=2925836 RepID=UPI001F60E675|nr:hypothetical protein [Micromonospora sp. R77]MCI4063071.1 hypothetical protein [Micromonospora sp. R77]
MARRYLTTGLAALLTTTGALAVTTAPASALLNFVQPVTTAWTDNAQPTRSFAAEDSAVPVGTWQQAPGDKHTSRAYFTFDLSGYQGQRIVNARAVTGERSVTNCDKPRELQLWLTENPATAPTWKDAPKAVQKLADLNITGPACPASYLSAAITEVVSKAVAAKQDKLTLMLRIGEHEDGLQWGRRVNTLGLSLEHNTAPDVPTRLAAGGIACRDDLFIGTTRPELQAVLTDPDVNETGGGDQLRPTFAWWPTDRPADRTEFAFTSPLPSGSRFQYRVPDGALTDGGTYAFSVRATDQYGDTSAWSPECRFTVDTKVPPAPTVASTDYPSGWDSPGHGGPGIPGKFTFSAPGADDVVGFSYGPYGPVTYVAADATGTATVSVTPTRAGPNRLYVRAIDRTGNSSSETVYEYRVRNTAPKITDANPTGGFGEPRELTFTPGMENVVSYTWRLNDGTPATVPAAADGTAKVTVTPRRGGPNTVTVTSRTSDDVPSGTGEYYFYLASTPTISSPDFPLDGGDGPLAGTPGTFTFAPGMPGVTEYVWSVNGGEQHTVAAGQDGKATVTYTPTEAGFQWIEVFSRTADGDESETASGYFVIFSHAPEVSSTDYPSYSESGGPGVTGSFTFHPARDGVTGYVYDFGDGPKTAAAAADGTATISWTPQSYPVDTRGLVRLKVREKIGDVVSDETEYLFYLGQLAPTVTSEDYPSSGGGAGGPGIAGSFTLTAHVPGSTEFVYRFGTEEKTVPAGPDGTATITLTPTEVGDNYLYVSSRTASGITSGLGAYWFPVANPG